MIIGAQKAGTSWLKEQLRSHPEIFMPRDELHFFDRAQSPSRDIAWYRRQFVDARDDQLVGEKTPNYLFLPDNPDIVDGHLRIVDVLPDVLLIAILREPVARAVSAVNHMIREGLVSPLHSIDELLGRRRGDLSWNVIEVGRYVGQVAAFLRLVGPDRLLLFFYRDDIVERPAATVETACRFLGVSPRWDADRLATRVNSGRPSRLRLLVEYYLSLPSRWTRRLDRLSRPYYALPTEATLRRLHECYEPYNERLFELIGRRPASGWRYAPEAVRSR